MNQIRTEKNDILIAHAFPIGPDDLRKGILPDEYLEAVYVYFIRGGRKYDVVHLCGHGLTSDPSLVVLSSENERSSKHFKAVEAIVAEETGGIVHRRERFHTVIELPPGLSQRGVADFIDVYNQRFNQSVRDISAQFGNIPNSVYMKSLLYPNRLMAFPIRYR